MNWFDGGYKEGDIIYSDTFQYTLLSSLGTLGWVAKNHDSGKKEILLFTVVEGVTF